MILCSTCQQPVVKRNPCELTTLMGFYSPAGHFHDPNRSTVSLYCPEGHETTVCYYRRCHCGWTAGAHPPYPVVERDELRKIDEGDAWTAKKTKQA